MGHLPIPSPAGREPERVRLGLEAEITTCADTGQPELIAAGDAWAFDTVSPAQLRAMVATHRERLSQIEALAARYEAITTPPSPCFPWCDHPRFSGDTQTHEGAKVRLHYPPAADENIPTEELLTAQLAYDEQSLGGPVVWIGANCNDGCNMGPDQAEEFAARLEAFAATVRALAQQAREQHPARRGGQELAA